jgi:hypothetical protein
MMRSQKERQDVLFIEKHRKKPVTERVWPVTKDKEMDNYCNPT